MWVCNPPKHARILDVRQECLSRAAPNGTNPQQWKAHQSNTRGICRELPQIPLTNLDGCQSRRMEECLIVPTLPRRQNRLCMHQRSRTKQEVGQQPLYVLVEVEEYVRQRPPCCNNGKKAPSIRHLKQQIIYMNQAPRYHHTFITERPLQRMSYTRPSANLYGNKGYTLCTDSQSISDEQRYAKYTRVESKVQPTMKDTKP